MSTEVIKMKEHKNIGRLISILHRQSQIYMNNALKEFNITSGEYPFMMYLYKNEGLTQDELSSYLYIDKAATARAIKSLIEKEYLLKYKDNSDKRCNRIYLTDKANKFKNEIRQSVWHCSDILSEDIDLETFNIVYESLNNMVIKIEKLNCKKNTED
jgi:DNA-binding MarR family transcriptional regulator